MTTASDTAPPVPGYRECDLSNRRTYVIGDIHGCLKELELLIEHLVSQNLLDSKDLLVFIGDYIDRGPDSKGVVDYLLTLKKDKVAETIFLSGNHEVMLLSYLGLGGGDGDVYLLNGGDTCFDSYGISPDIYSDKKQREKVISLLPEDHLAFYTECERYVVSDKYIFVHAGLSPLRDLKFQLDEDIYWIRDEFIHNLHYFKRTIVFGHTPFEDTLFHLPYKIGIDTGLVYGNALTAIELSEEKVIQVPADQFDVEVFTFKQKGGLWPKLG